MAPPTVKSHWSIILHINLQISLDWLRLSHKLCPVLTDRCVAGKREGWCVLWNDLFWLTVETLTLTNETLVSGCVTLQGKTNGSPSFMYTTSGISDCIFTNGRWLSETTNAEVRTNRHHIHTVDADNNLESATNTERLLACYQTLSLSHCCFLGCTFASVAIFLWQWKALGVARPIVWCSAVIKGTEKKYLNILTKVPQGLLDASLSCFDSI